VGRGRLPDLEPRDFLVPGALSLPEIGASLEARCFEAGPGYVVPRAASTVVFDADRIPSRLTVRARRRGDRFLPWGGPQERRLKSFLIDAGVPRWERARVPLLEAGGDLIWVAGLRRGQAAPVGSDTKRILEVTLSVPLVVAPPGR
jgi:tRNA(Ile)-lysidine synthase